MTKVLKLEYLKFKSYRPFWIILGLFVLAYFALGFSTKRFLTFLLDEGPDEFKHFTEAGLPMFDFIDLWQNLAYITFMFKYILAFVVIISICTEYSHKTIRQNFIDGLSRKEFIASKLGLIASLSILAGLLLLLLGLALGLLYSPVTSPEYIFMKLQFVPAYMLEVFCFLCFAMFIAFLLRRTGFAIVLFVLYSLAIEPIATAIMWHEYEIPVWYFPVRGINNLIPVPFAKYIFREVQDYVALRHIAAALGWAALFIFFSFSLLRKRDA